MIRIRIEGTDKWYEEQPEWGTPESTAKAKKMTPMENTEIEKEYGKVFVDSAIQIKAQKKKVDELKAKLDAFGGKSSVGLTSNETRSNPKWKSIKSQLDAEFKKLQNMNSKMTKIYGKQIKDLRNKDRKAYQDLFVKEGHDSDPCWDTHKQVGMKKKGGKMVPNCVPKEEQEESCCDECDETYNHEISESEYQGKKVKLNDPFRLPSGSKKKFGVYTKNDKGNIVKVTFGDPNMEIKRDDPKRLKAYRSRMGCDTDPGPKWKANYWSCYQWRSSAKVDEEGGPLPEYTNVAGVATATDQPVVRKKKKKVTDFIRRNGKVS